MSYQECALYGELVLWLRDRAAELLAEARGEDTTSDDEADRLDDLIRGWFFTPQDELHGCAPRDIIWAEQMGKPNPIPQDRLDEFFFDDCPICQQMKDEVGAAEAEGHDHGWQWFYDDGGYPLIARYDPEGWDERWAEDEARYEALKAEREQRESTAAPGYQPPPVESKEVDAETFVEIMRQPWLDPESHRAAQELAERCDVPMPGGPFGPPYRRLRQDEALSLVAGLHRYGVDIGELMKQIEAWPYQNVALDWLSEPEQNAALMCYAMETQIDPDDEVALTRFRHHRDFIFSLARLVPPHVRLWLQGWLEAVGHGAFVAGQGTVGEGR